MKTSPLFASVKLYFDTPRDVQVGDLIMTKSGRAYQVLEARRQTRGKHAGRWHLRVFVLVERGLTGCVHQLDWYRR